jgi:hypothetical protein
MSSATSCSVVKVTGFSFGRELFCLLKSVFMVFIIRVAKFSEKLKIPA